MGSAVLFRRALGTGVSDRVELGIGGAVARVLAGVYASRFDSWADAVFPKNTSTIFLDLVYPRIVKGSWVVLEREFAIGTLNLVR